MEIVHRFTHNHNGIDYYIQVEKGAMIHEIAVYPADGARPLYSYSVPLRSPDKLRPDRAGTFWFLVAARAFDFIDAQP
jgi:hypothetical protein